MIIHNWANWIIADELLRVEQADNLWSGIISITEQGAVFEWLEHHIQQEAGKFGEHKELIT